MFIACHLLILTPQFSFPFILLELEPHSNNVHMPKDSYHDSVCINLVKYGLIEKRLYEGFQDHDLRESALV